MRSRDGGSACNFARIPPSSSFRGVVNASLKCAACGLVQFVGEAGRCARCGTVFGAPAPISTRPEASVARSSPPRAISVPPSIAPRPPVQLTAESLGLAPRLASRSTPTGAAGVNPWHRRIQLMALSGVLLVVLAVMLSFSYRAAMRYLYADVEGAAEPVQHVTSDGVLSVITPASFVSHRSARATSDVVLELENPRDGSFLMAMTLRKALFGRVVSLTQVANGAREGLTGATSSGTCPRWAPGPSRFRFSSTAPRRPATAH